MKVLISFPLTATHILFSREGLARCILIQDLRVRYPRLALCFRCMSETNLDDADDRCLSMLRSTSFEDQPVSTYDRDFDLHKKRKKYYKHVFAREMSQE